MLIGLLAKKHRGKDTFADRCCDLYDFKKKTFAGPLKEVCRILFMFNDTQLYGEEKEIVDDRWNISPRKAFQFIGTDLVRNQMWGLIDGIENNFWLKRMEMECKGEGNVVFSDVRFQNEVDFIHKLGGIVIKIERDVEGEEDLHESELAIDNIKNFDMLCKNDGTLDEYFKKIDDTIMGLKN